MLARFMILAAVLAPVAAQDSGFLRGTGRLDLSIGYSLDTYDRFWVGGSRVDNPPFGRVERHALNLRAEYGLADDLDLIGNVSAVRSTIDAVFDDETSLQDLITGIKWRARSWRLGPGSFNVLAAPSLKIPLADYEDDAVNAIGDGQVDLRLRGILQYHFDAGPFVAVESGYDVRFDDPPDEVPIGLTAGFTAGVATISAFFLRVDALGGYDIGQGPFPGVGEEYDRLGIATYWRLHGRVGVSVSWWTTLDGRNTGDVDGGALGVVVRF